MKGFVTSFRQSNWITDAWNWFMVLAGKAAEPVLILSVLYSSAKLLPAIQPYLTAQFDAVVFIAQFIALDVGGLSLNKMANLVQATNPRGATQAKRLSIALVVIMIAGVILASLAPVMAKAPQLASGIDTFLLICRAILAVLYSRVIHGLKGQDDGGSPPPREPEQFMQEVHDLVHDAVNQAVREQAGSQQEFMNQRTQELAGLQQEFMNQVTSSVNLLEQRVASALADLHAASSSRSPAGQLRLLSRPSAHIQPEGAVHTDASVNLPGVHEPVDDVHVNPSVNLPRIHEPVDDVHVNLPEVHDQATQVHGRISREQVVACVVNFWQVHGSRPTLKMVMEETGCSRGLASQCINQVASDDEGERDEQIS